MLLFFCTLITLALLIFPGRTLLAQKSAVTFDIPALIPAQPIEVYPTSQTMVDDHPADRSGMQLVGYRRPTNTKRESEKLIEIIVPVTSEVNGNHQTIDAFRFDVFWNRIAFPLVDYAPKTQTTSKIIGPVGIESHRDRKHGIGLNLSGKYESYLNGSLNGNWSDHNSTTKRYDEVPQHDVLIASGTSHRGTGAFFRFHPSHQETLEGGRELAIAFRVPQTWRAGVLKVECRAVGTKRSLAWKEEINIGRAFVVPVYLDGDDEARESAVALVRAEQQLRKSWQQRRTKKRKPVSVFSFAEQNESQPPANWVDFLIQSGDDNYLEKYRMQLAPEIAEKADAFVAARQTVVDLGRK
ncbi:MAG: hypothetical protein AAFN77_16915 [Planctomycetota bacterium]